MKIIINDDDKKSLNPIGAEYTLHYWHRSIKSLAGYLDRMANTLRAFDEKLNKKNKRKKG